MHSSMRTGTTIITPRPHGAHVVYFVCIFKDGCTGFGCVSCMYAGFILVLVLMCTDMHMHMYMYMRTLFSYGFVFVTWYDITARVRHGSGDDASTIPVTLEGRVEHSTA